MIDCLYDCFKHWAANGSVYIMSDTHFDDDDCKLMCPNWISPEEQVEILNKKIYKNDTLILLGDIGNPEWIKKIKARQKILITGNHDVTHLYKDVFTEIYDGGMLAIAPKLLLSHEPINGLKFVCNIHGHDHGGKSMYYTDSNGAKHLNVAANVCDFTPINLATEIKNGLMSNIQNIHRVTIDNATKNSLKKKKRVREISE